MFGSGKHSYIFCCCFGWGSFVFFVFFFFFFFLLFFFWLFVFVFFFFPSSSSSSYFSSSSSCSSSPSRSFQLFRILLIRFVLMCVLISAAAIRMFSCCLYFRIVDCYKSTLMCLCPFVCMFFFLFLVVLPVLCFAKLSYSVWLSDLYVSSVLPSSACVCYCYDGHYCCVSTHSLFFVYDLFLIVILISYSSSSCCCFLFVSLCLLFVLFLFVRFITHLLFFLFLMCLFPLYVLLFINILTTIVCFRLFLVLVIRFLEYLMFHVVIYLFILVGITL